MTRGVRLYLVGSFVLVSLAGCGRGIFQSAEREPWRAEAEVACLKSGAVKETADLVRINPISGPGVCGAEFPLKVAALGESSSSFGFADELRPPAGIGGDQPRWPDRGRSPRRRCRPIRHLPIRNTAGAAAAGLWRRVQRTDFVDRARRGAGCRRNRIAARRHALGGDRADERATVRSPGGPSMPIPRTTAIPRRLRYGRGSAAGGSQDYSPLPRLGPAQGNSVTAFGPVAMTPTATLACPIVSALDRWLADFVQPSAMRWFGARVVEIKQISAYSCRGMNGNSRAHISEHAFGNALDIAAFTLADGRRVTVKDGWKGMPEEQGFLRDDTGRGVPAVQHRAGAGLQRLSLRSHPRRPDAPLQPPRHLPAGRGVRRGNRFARIDAQLPMRAASRR